MRHIEGRRLSQTRALNSRSEGRAPGVIRTRAAVTEDDRCDPDAPDPKAPKMVWVHWVVYNQSFPSRSGLKLIKWRRMIRRLRRHFRCLIFLSVFRSMVGNQMSDLWRCEKCGTDSNATLCPYCGAWCVKTIEPLRSEAGMAAAKQASESIASLARLGATKRTKRTKRTPVMPTTWNHRVLFDRGAWRKILLYS
jgi:hypothetical protein